MYSELLNAQVLLKDTSLKFEKLERNSNTIIKIQQGIFICEIGFLNWTSFVGQYESWDVERRGNEIFYDPEESILIRRNKVESLNTEVKKRGYDKVKKII